MSTTANVDYISTVFEYPVLTKIHDVPTYELLKKIKDELKTNATKVQCDLGGGSHGHLGLLLSAADYQKVTTEVYIRPTHPGEFSPGSKKQVAATMDLDKHKEKIRLYREMNAVEQALLKQLSEALPPLYLKQYRDTHSNKISTPIRDILEDLMQTYGAISAEELEEREQTLKARVFDITQPLVTLYNAVEDLQELAEASDSPFSEKQLVAIGVRLIKNMNEMEKERGKWLTKPKADQTWPNFKQHFTDAWNDLRTLRGPTMKDTTYQHQANLIRQEVMTAMREEHAALVQEVKDSNESLLAAFQSVPPFQQNKIPVTVSTEPTQITDTSSITQTANKVEQDTVQLQMLEILQKIDKKLDNTKFNPKRPRSEWDPLKRKKPQREGQCYVVGFKKRWDISKYCHSHGACAHLSATCNQPKVGHKKSATFKNKMGGCTDFCQFVNT